MDNRIESTDQPGIMAKSKGALREISKDKRVAEMIKIIAEEVTPGAAKAFRKGYRAIIKIENEQRQERLAAFISGIAKDNPEIPDIPPEDFLAVVRKLLQDDEDTKVWLYVRLCVMLAKSNLDRDTRLYFLRMTSELTMAQILFARELYLRHGTPLKGFRSKDKAKSELTGAENGMTLRALSTLSNWGLIKARNVVADSAGYDLTGDLHQLMELLFSPQDLTAEAIGFEAKDTSDVIIVNHIKSVNDLLLIHFRQVLEKSGLTVEVVERNDNFLEMKHARCYITNRYYSAESSDRQMKEFVAMYVLRHPDNSTTMLEHPDRQFLVAKDSFLGKGAGKDGGADLLIKELDKMAAYIVERLQTQI